MSWIAMLRVGSCLQCLLLFTAVFAGCSETHSDSEKKTTADRMAKDAATGQSELDDRLFGEWEHVFKEDEAYPAGKNSLYPPGMISVIRFSADGVQIATSFFPNGEEKQLQRRWRVEYTFPDTRDSFQVWRQDLDSSLQPVNIWWNDVVHVLDANTITIQGPADIQAFVYKRRVSFESKGQTKR